jgi:calcium-dependent protein kinase
MGCCNRTNIKPNDKKKDQFKQRRSSILLENFSKITDYRKKYEYINIIGNGGFGKVRLFKDRNCQDMKYAIKTVKKDFLNMHGIESLIKEVEILTGLDHPNIVKYFETYEDDHYLHIVMEFIPGDNLWKVITNRKHNSFGEKDAAEILTCIFQSVYFLHQHEIVHRDIKPENILFSLSGDYQSLKLIDFGLSTPLSTTKQKYRVGSPYYMSPEMLKGDYQYASDAWSIGVILYVMMTGKYPFNGKDQNEVFEKIRKGVYDVKLLDKSKASPEVQDLIKQLLVQDASKRLSLIDALHHPWIIKHKENTHVTIDDDILDSLKNFTKQTLLQKEILFFLAKISDEKEIFKLKQAFSGIDKDNSGTIEVEEILTIFNQLGKDINKEEIEQIWEGMDFHSDGKVNYSEFLAATLSSVVYNI